uniref:Adenylyl cyclase-associated protein n=1 Tax=Ananas comosus var. bracteatus TaxID=296719 RepID=A0A6V7NI65_ANACO|nr:unnamed protein product [Ananas comosus var. bracteatus]
MEAALVERLEAAVTRLEAALASSSSSAAAAAAAARDLPAEAAPADPAIAAFDDLVGGPLRRVSAAAEKIGGKVLEATKILEEAFAAEKDLLIKAKKCQKPDIAGLVDFLKPLNDVIVKATALTEGRRPDYFNHLKTTADSLSALAWIAYLGKDCGMNLPIAHVEESWQMAEFYNNKVLVEYRNKDPDHVEWAKALKDLYLPGLRDYVKCYYPLGLSWAPAGAATTVSAPPPSTSASSVSKAPPAKAPAPPPPPPASLFSSETPPSQPKSGMSAVFKEISSGKAVTAGLKKVTDDMKTKNRTDRTGVVATTEKASRSGSFSFNRVGPPKLELQMGRKWAVENQIGKKNLIIEDCDSKQSVYVYGCKDSVLQVKGKVNNITVDKCTKTGIVFTDVVAACEIVNCNGVEVQCQGTAPTISIDNTSGCQLYLSNDSLGASITTAKSSEINVMVPSGGPDGDWVEHALPQQYIHSYKDGQFTTSPVSHSGG